MIKKRIILLFFILLQISQAQTVNLPKVITGLSRKDSIKIDVLSTMFFDSVYTNSKASKRINNQIFAIAKKNNSNYTFSKAYNFLGIISDVEGRFDSAKIYYKKSLYYSKTIHSHTSEASAYNNLGLIEWNMGNLKTALLYYHKALVIFEKINKQEYVANVLSNIGEIYGDLDDLKKSENYILKSYEIRKKINDDYGMSVSLINLGGLYDKKKQYKQSIKYYESGIILKRKMKDLLGIAISNNNYSLVLLKTGKLLEAKEALEESLKICKETEAESNILENTYLGLCEVNISLNQLKEAKLYNQNALLISGKLKDRKRLLLYNNNEEKISVLEKNFKKAHYYLKIQDSISKIIEGVDVKNAINLYETKYQTAQKEKLILRQQTESKQKNIWLILISSIATIGLLLFRQQRLKSRQQKQQSRLENELLQEQSNFKIQEQRLDISRELHDSVGSQLTFIISILDNMKNAPVKLENAIEKKIDNLSGYANNSISELRDTIWALNTDNLTISDLETRILNFVKEASEAVDGIDFNFENKVLYNFTFSSKQGINIFRVVQETVNNAVKHAGASKIDVFLSNTENELLMTIQDNGKGFDYEEKKKKSYGLSNITKRIEELNGTINLSSNQAGTVINCKIPIV